MSICFKKVFLYYIKTGNKVLQEPSFGIKMVSNNNFNKVFDWILKSVF